MVQPSGKPTYLEVAQIQAPWGIGGAVKVSVQTDFPERFISGACFFLGEDLTPVTIEWARPHKGGFLIKFRNYADRDAVEELRGALLQIPVEEAVPLPPGEYYIYQILGLEVVTDTGEILGRIGEIIPGGANDIYVVDTPDGELLLPTIPDVVLNVDLAQGRLLVHLLPGLR
ncbi:MAG: 16S rRNA processing protein RimM [Chloroflexi bacterium]|nr:16S rRNA processing protein RimM [Chloroflexota bacterium]